MRLKFKIAIHQLTHSEYWPIWTFYVATFFLWVFEMIRSRNISLFKYVNPGIEQKGLIDTSKWEIYQKLPLGTYPETLKWDGESLKLISSQLEERQIEYPFIVKPEYGYRGIGVAKIHSEQELREYDNQSVRPFLIQEMIDHTHEAGIFYIRHPEEEKGRITSIAAKEFLHVKGDGERTIKDLLTKNPRGLMQLERLHTKIDLMQIPEKGEEIILEEIGSHNLGTRFYEFEEEPSNLLINRIDQIASSIEGFYYGRFDIRFQSWDELQKGKGFHIIEVNDVISEPTHMYDQKYNYWFAIREVYRYHKEMFSIARFNYKLAKKETAFKKKSLITT